MRALLSLLATPFRSGPRRPLAMRQPGREEMKQQRDVPLGMEATDLDLIARVNRTNDALERVTALPRRTKGEGQHTAGASIRVTPMPDDETYAAHYHRAYTQKDT